MKATLVLIGAGNIGTHAAPLLARIPGVGALTVVDQDVFTAANARGQAIEPGDVGKPKALVIAERLRRQAPGLVVCGFHAPLEHLPLGTFRADLIVTGLDSRRARQQVNEIAFRVGGVPVIDGGVRADGLLARVSVYDPRDPNAACLECGWSRADYARLEQILPCQVGTGSGATPPTNAPAALGGLVAALQALEAEKWLGRRADRLPAGSEVMIDAAAHTYQRTTNRRRPSCRFDHACWRVTPVAASPATLTVADALVLGARGSDGTPRDGDTLAVAGQAFLAALVCAACGTARPAGKLVVALQPSDLCCAVCGHQNAPRGFDLEARLALATLSSRALRRPLATFGIRSGDVVTVTRAGRARHFELGARRAARRQR